MPLKPFPHIKPFTTHHCVTGSMRRIYEAHGYPISEDLLLGLGAGVGIIYWEFKGAAPIFGGRANVGRPGEEGLEKTAGRRTGVQVEYFRTSSSGKAEKVLLELLAASEPVMIYVDMGFLRYLNLPGDYHFGSHAIVVAGYDPETHQVLIADRDAELHPLSLEELQQARGSKFKPFPPQHLWYTFDFSQAFPPRPDEIWQAIKEVTTGMLEPPISNLGVKGIRKAASQIVKWPRTMPLEALRWNVFNLFIFIDATGGTGGGIFRYMYGRFLHEAAQITGCQELSAIGNELQAIGDRWQTVAGIFKQAWDDPDPAALLPEAAERMLAIADQEQAAWEQLRKIR